MPKSTVRGDNGDEGKAPQPAIGFRGQIRVLAEPEVRVSAEMVKADIEWCLREYLRRKTGGKARDQRSKS